MPLLPVRFSSDCRSAALRFLLCTAVLSLPVPAAQAGTSPGVAFPMRLIDDRESLPCLPVYLEESIRGDILLETVNCGAWILPRDAKQFRRIGKSDDFHQIAVSHDGRYVAGYIAEHYETAIIELPSMKEHARLKVGQRAVSSCGSWHDRQCLPRSWFSARNTNLVTEYADGSMTVYRVPAKHLSERVASQEPGAEVPSHYSSVFLSTAAAFRQAALDAEPGRGTPLKAPLPPAISAYESFVSAVARAGPASPVLESSDYRTRAMLDARGGVWIAPLGEEWPTVRARAETPQLRASILKEGSPPFPVGTISGDGTVLYLANAPSVGCSGGPGPHIAAAFVDILKGSVRPAPLGCEKSFSLSRDGRRFACVRIAGGVRKKPTADGLASLDAPAESSQDYELLVLNVPTGEAKSLRWQSPYYDRNAFFFSPDGAALYTLLPDAAEESYRLSKIVLGP